MGQLSDLLRASLARLDTARYELRATDPDAAFTFMGEGARLLNAAIPQVEALEGTPGPVDPPPTPGAQFVAPIPNGAICGRDKWLLDAPGDHSYGCDMFCQRGTPVVAPADCVVEEVIGGTALSGGAEIILAMAGNAVAWRYRHVQATVRVGQAVKQGQKVATVGDTSLDMLCPQPVVGFPDRWQHVDLSVSKGSDRFPPTGGGGGNYPAAQWLAEMGYQGQWMARTPGPPSCGFGEAEAILMMTPPERREEASA